MAAYSVFGGTLALFEMIRRESETWPNHPSWDCPTCKMALSREISDWVTDQALKQSFKVPMLQPASSAAGEGIS